MLERQRLVGVVGLECDRRGRGCLRSAGGEVGVVGMIGCSELEVGVGRTLVRSPAVDMLVKKN